MQSLFVRGDATGNDEVELADAISTLNHLFRAQPARPCRDALDANDDGSVDISDPTFTLVYLFLGGAEIPAPFPIRGADRTDDGLRCRPGEAG